MSFSKSISSFHPHTFTFISFIHSFPLQTKGMRLYADKAAIWLRRPGPSIALTPTKWRQRFHEDDQGLTMKRRSHYGLSAANLNTFSYHRAKDSLKVYDIILQKYWSKLCNNDKSMLLRSRATSCLKQNHIQKCRESLLQSLKLNPPGVKTLLLLFLTYMPNSPWIYLKYRGIRNVRPLRRP